MEETSHTDKTVDDKEEIQTAKEFYKELITFARRHNVFVINDFVYGEMCLQGSCADSMLSPFSDFQGIAEVYSLSKAYSIPGWRVGALIGDEEDWDLVAIGRYPNLSSFLSLYQNQEYIRAFTHRTAALERQSVLVMEA